ncbi:MAG: hypothetical protein KAR38_12075 [Calditrichia bacterium]|nr:hypothetical protein [Calditrichia bacterium]
MLFKYVMIFTILLTLGLNAQDTKMDSVLNNQEKMLKNQEEILAKVTKNEGFEGRDIVNNMAMPTGYTLNKGEFTIGLGSSIAYGVSDKFQLGSNVLLFLFQIYNVNAKYNFYNQDGLSAAGGVNFSRFDLDVFGNDASFTTIAPFAVLSKDLNEKTRLHISGHYSHFSSDENIEDAEANSSSSGTSGAIGLEHSISKKTKFLGEGGYDFTFKGVRVGGTFLWGWEHFRLKLGVNYFKPESSSEGFTFPHIGIYWRFKG